MAFDILFVNNEPMKNLRLVARKELLAANMQKKPYLFGFRFSQKHGIVVF